MSMEISDGGHGPPYGIGGRLNATEEWAGYLYVGWAAPTIPIPVPLCSYEVWERANQLGRIDPGRSEPDRLLDVLRGVVLRDDPSLSGDMNRRETAGDKAEEVRRLREIVGDHYDAKPDEIPFFGVA